MLDATERQHRAEDLDRRVAALDPIGLDARLPAIAAMNARADVTGLLRLLRQGADAVPDPATFPFAACLAAMRDLGILLGSVKRHGIEPAVAVPQLEPLLVALGERAGMVPRDTVHHYSRWNPEGPRCRSYTGTREELVLIASVRTSLPRLGRALEVCRRLDDLDPGEVDFVVGLNELVGLLRSMEDGVDGARASIPPMFFAQVLRPYYEHVHVAGERYLGPSGSHVPLTLIDLAVWGCDHDDDELTRLWREPARYGPPHWWLLGERWETGSSLASRVRTACADRPGEAGPIAAADAVTRALRALVTFRGRHVQLARGAYAEETGARYEAGSGGATVDLLERLLALTRANARLAALDLRALRVRARG